jgi:hypothetical protein
MEDQTEILDQYITNCMLSAEATIHCHSLDDFSPKKVEMATLEKFWKLSLHAHRTKSTTPTQPMINIMERFLMTDFSGFDNKTTIIEKLRESKERYKEAIAHGKELLHEFLLEKAEIAHQNGNLTMEAAIKQLAHIEATIQTYASIKRVMHRTAYQPGLTSIRIPTEDGSYKTIMDPKEIVAWLLDRNLNHYAQAEKTAMDDHRIRKKWGHWAVPCSATRC